MQRGGISWLLELCTNVSFRPTSGCYWVVVKRTRRVSPKLFPGLFRTTLIFQSIVKKPCKTWLCILRNLKTSYYFGSDPCRRCGFSRQAWWKWTLVWIWNSWYSSSSAADSSGLIKCPTHSQTAKRVFMGLTFLLTGWVWTPTNLCEQVQTLMKITAVDSLTNEM